MTTCARCYHEDTAIHYGGDDFCQNCIEQVFVRCGSCNEHVHRLDVQQVEGRNYCAACHDENFVTCDNCGNVTTRQRAHRHESIDLCDGCYDRIVRNAPPPAAIRSYAYKPSPVFHSVGDERKIFMGIELEIDMPRGHRDTNSDARTALVILGDGDTIYAKGDGSLHCGIEFVTHPCTMEYYRTLPWERFLSTLYGFGYRGNEVNTAGLHIHVGKRELGTNSEHRTKTMARLIRFYDKYYDDIMRFSRRQSGAAHQWANGHGVSMDMSDNDTVRYAMGHGRYRAVNVTPSATVEFRIFKSTLDPNALIASIQFTSELVKAAVDLSDDEFNRLTYRKHIDNVSALYPEMRTYMAADRTAIA